MEYFVAIQNSFYFHWQIELLIESFKLQGLQDKLWIAISDHDKLVSSNCTRNLLEHPNKMLFKCDLENQFLHPLHALYSALVSKQLKQPLTIIHSDMIMVEPLEVPITNLVFSADYYWQDLVRKDNIEIKTLLSDIEKIKSDLADHPVKLDLLPMGGIVQCRDLPLGFFERLLQWGSRLSQKLDKAHWKYVHRLAWMFTFYDYLGGVSFTGKNLESTMIDDSVYSFVHYSFGLPPVFTKKYFKEYDPDLSLNLHKDPLEAMIQNPVTKTCQKINTVINSYHNG